MRCYTGCRGRSRVRALADATIYGSVSFVFAIGAVLGCLVVMLGIVGEMFGVVWAAFWVVRLHTELPWNTPEHHWNTPKFRGDRMTPSGPLYKRHTAT